MLDKEKTAILCSTALGLVIFVIILCSGVFKKELPTENNNKLKSGTSVSMMLETKYGSGDYKKSDDTKWPTDGYEFNAELSKCDNGGTLSWNSETHSVILKTSMSDRCYVYFDKMKEGIDIAVNNLPTTYGKLGSITCNNSTATYNQRYNRIEISDLSKSNDQCTLNYADSSSKVNFASYITSLKGKTSGTGQVVSETAIIPDYSNVTAIAQSAYTNQSTFSSSSYWDSSGTTVSGMYTFSSNQWTSVSSSMTSGKYYHFKFTPSESGYYQLCYNLTSGSTENRLHAFVNDTQRYFGTSYYLSASSSTATSGCIELGYVSTSDYIRLSQRAYTDISTLSFSIKKGSYTSQNAGIRYEGKNPNNYVWFNNEYWRIIGVFDSNSHGQSGKNLVKIIRAETLDGLTWNKDDENDWSTANLNSLLNGNYYNATDGTDSGYCIGNAWQKEITGNCDYTKRGIQSGYRNMIAKVTWYLGGSSTNAATVGSFYGYERGKTVYSGRPTSTTGKIGLMYPSDYGYSVLSNSCGRTTYLSSYIGSSCAEQNWLFGKLIEWTLTPSSVYSDDIFEIAGNGYVGIQYAAGAIGVRPVLYLESSVYKIDGSGTLDSPYIIGM